MLCSAANVPCPPCGHSPCQSPWTLRFCKVAWYRNYTQPVAMNNLMKPKFCICTSKTVYGIKWAHYICKPEAQKAHDEEDDAEMTSGSD